MIVNHFIDLADRLEVVEIMKPNSTIMRKIIIDNKTQVLAKVRKDDLGLILWIDRFKLSKKRYGITVC